MPELIKIITLEDLEQEWQVSNERRSATQVNNWIKKLYGIGRQRIAPGREDYYMPPSSINGAIVSETKRSKSIS